MPTWATGPAGRNRVRGGTGGFTLLELMIVLFLVVLFCGYLMGITHKLLYSRDPVIFLYALNGGMVFVDMMLFLRNRRLEEMCEDGPRKGAGNEIRGKG